MRFREAFKKIYRSILWGKQYYFNPKEVLVKNSYGTKFTSGSPTIIHYDQEGKLSIGEYCSIGPEVLIVLGGEHLTTKPSTYPFDKLIDPSFPTSCFSKGNVTIGNDVWIGARATILSGVTIGDGAVVGAGSVVASDIAPYSIVIGNPARVLRMRFNPETIQKLEASKWWTWPLEKIHSELYSLI